MNDSCLFVGFASQVRRVSQGKDFPSRLRHISNSIGLVTRVKVLMTHEPQTTRQLVDSDRWGEYE
jgi:hypothetical protein